MSVFISKDNKNPFILPSGPSDSIACETACKQCDNIVMKERLFISEVEYFVLSELSPISDVKATCEQKLMKTFVLVNSSSFTFVTVSCFIRLSPHEQRLPYVQLSPPAS